MTNPEESLWRSKKFIIPVSIVLVLGLILVWNQANSDSYAKQVAELEEQYPDAVVQDENQIARGNIYQEAYEALTVTTDPEACRQILQELKDKTTAELELELECSSSASAKIQAKVKTELAGILRSSQDPFDVFRAAELLEKIDVNAAKQLYQQVVDMVGVTDDEESAFVVAQSKKKAASL